MLSGDESSGGGEDGRGTARLDALRRLLPQELDELAARLGVTFYIRGRGAPAEQAVDLAHLCDRDEAHQTIADDFMRSRGASAPDLLATYLQWVVRELDHVPIFYGDGGEGRLTDVHVRLLHRSLPSGGASPAADGAELTLTRLLDLQPRGRWTLQGDPGAGKTTELRYLAIERAKAALAAPIPGPASVPILMGLPALGEALATGGADTASPFAAVAGEVAATVGYERINVAWLEEILRAQAEAGRVLLLLDGVDEVRPEHASAVRERVAAWERHLDACAIVVTSRRFGYHRPSLAFGELVLLPLPWEEQRSLLTGWLDEGQAATILAQIDRHPPLQDMAGNPLVLALMAFVARERAQDPATRDKPLPGRRLELYREVLRCFCKGCARKEPRSRLPLKPEDLRAALGELALSLLRDHAGPWTHQELERHIAGVPALARLAAGDRSAGADLGPGDRSAVADRAAGDRSAVADRRTGSRSAVADRRTGGRSAVADRRTGGRSAVTDRTVDRSLIADIAADTGLLAPDDRAGIRWAFRHRSLLECLAAEALHAGGARTIWSLARRVSGDRRWWHLFSGPGPDQTGRWAEVFALLAGMSDDPLAFLRDLRRRGSAKLALRALANVPDVSAEDLIAELGVVGSLELVRELMARIEEREQLVARLADLFRVTTEPEGRAYVAAALLAVGAEEVLPALLGDGVSPAEVGLAPRSWVAIEAGTFWMGSLETEAGRFTNEGPRHEVSLTEPFETLATPVTQALYAVVMGTNPSRFTGDVQRPVETVSWDDAQRFCERLGALQGRNVRLPTEAEWEHACRAGTETAYSFGETADRLGDHAWYRGNSDGEAHPVAQKLPNPWELYDMHGNVWEWCADSWRSYGASSETDPLWPTDGMGRAMRGGSAWLEPRSVRSAVRVRYQVGFRYWFHGFRCVRSRLRQP